MATSATVPVTVSAEAQGRVAELGLQKEFEQMLEHALQTVPDLRRIRVELEEQTDEIDDPLVVIWAHRTLMTLATADRADIEYVRWSVHTLGAKVAPHIVLNSLYEDRDAQ